ncbi:tripeptidyl-peptidase II Tpp2 [Clonorchis sinensis]|uniref:Tripeptidyl-peptidase II Tpp2 n=1 Tax=Clonorchis sinensis TaxID=79923 RepID=A0A8T1MIR3_CLOSI|nr:tripeptidyl-peptidase II Tpp2 [Clonorchis sinensis]
MNTGELLPRHHINVDVLASNNPTVDGRNTTIAIWDTGVDPTADGLQITSDGKPKIIDMIDASGSGDVKMTGKRYIDLRSREITTLTGRRVTVPQHWNPPDGLVRLGVKLASELFPRPLIQRLRSEEKENFWRPFMRHLAATVAEDVIDTQTALSELQSSDSNLQDGNADGNMKRENADKSKKTQCDSINESPMHQLKTGARLLEESLTTLDRHYSPQDMVFDCFVFHNGSHWVGCVDTSPYETGKTLADMPLLADYSHGHQHACFGSDTQLFYTVKIFNHGKLLQIVTNDSGHGTHVAAMAAAYFPCDQKTVHSSLSGQNRNGVAPGAQIVSIKISDSRLGSMETGISLLRAIRWTVELKCDVVNYSFGEYCVWPNVGRVCKHLSELMHAHGVVMVASGGNNGPSLGTVGCPGGVVEGLIGVAPLVFPDMMLALYSQPVEITDLCDADVDEDPSNYATSTSDLFTATSDIQVVKQVPQPAAYTWGSRGPTVDGALGLCVAAPGAANTSVAGWQMRPSALLNGSSMSAPLVTGGVALLLSGLREQGDQFGPSIRIPPSLVRLAISNTAIPIKHLSLFDQGCGLLQVDKALDYLKRVLSHINEPSTNGPDMTINHISGNSECSMNHTMLDRLPNPATYSLDDPKIMFGWRLRCTVTGPGCSGSDRGIWLRRGWIPRPVLGRPGQQSFPILRFTVHIGLEFDQCVPPEFRRRLEVHLKIKVDNTAQGRASTGLSWLQVASFVSVTSLGRDISLVMDPNKCWPSPPIQDIATDVVEPERIVHKHTVSQEGTLLTNSPSSPLTSTNPAPFKSCEPFVTILRFEDETRPDMGSLALIPIVIHNPIQLPLSRGLEHPRLSISDRFDSSHKVRRWFINIPTGATAGVLRLSRLDQNDTLCEFKVTVSFPQPRSGLTAGQQEVTWPLLNLNRCGQGGTTLGRQRGVTGKRVGDDFEGASQLAFPICWESDYMELTIAQHWGLEAPAVLIGELYFRGLEPSQRQISMCSSDHYIRLVLRSNFATEDLSPNISLSHWVLPVRPSESKIFYLGHGQNEVLLTGRGCYALRLVYVFHCPFKYSLTQFELPWLHELLYESDYLLQLYHLYDSRGRFLGAGDFDMKRPKRPKFAQSLDKGDYKVVVQICHETGPNLNGAGNKTSADTSVGAGNALADDRVSGGVGGGALSGDTLSPLERLRQHCAVVRFRLPGPGQSDSPAEKRTAGKSNIPVSFEFSAFPFSLGLNGAKPCSALDSIPYNPPKATTLRFDRANNSTHENVAKHFEGMFIVDESSRRCSCLPTSLCANESTGLCIGLSEQRYPAYTVPGSHFTGTIGFYNSDLLQHVVTYPFRLVVDNLPHSSSSSPKRADSDRGNRLQVSKLGLSEEDFAWLRPLNAWLLGDKDNISISNEVIPEADEQAMVPVEHKDSEITDDGVSCPASGELFQTTERNNVRPTSASSSAADGLNEMDEVPLTKCNGSMEDDTNKTDHDWNTQTDELSAPKDTVGTVSKATMKIDVGSDPTVDGNEGCNNSTPTTRGNRSLNIKLNPRSVRRNSATRSLSYQLASVHGQLVSLDTPLAYRDKFPDRQALHKNRAYVWAKADKLISGHILDADKAILDPNELDSLVTDDQGFFHHLLTMRLVSSQSSSTTGSESRRRASTLSAASNGNNLNNGSVISTESAPRPVTPNSLPAPQAPEDLRASSESLSGQSSKLKRDEKVTFSYLELKLRLLDTLARYGRLLCERVLMTSAGMPDSSNSNASSATDPNRGIHSDLPTPFGWSLQHWLCQILPNSNDSHHPINNDGTHTGGALPECHDTLRQINRRLIQQITLSTSGTNSIGEAVRVGAHALPAWLVVSGLRDLQLDESEPKGADESRILGSVGGRIMIFFLLYALAENEYAHALRMLTRIAYQTEEPPTGALNGSINCGSVTSMGSVRSVIASSSGTSATSRQGYRWMVWLLHRMGWTELAGFLHQQMPLIWPKRDYSLLADV